jgi:hypothetical protein
MNKDTISIFVNLFIRKHGSNELLKKWNNTDNIKSFKLLDNNSTKPEINGKSFEFAICKAIKNEFNTPVAEKSINLFFQYSSKFETLPVNIQDDFNISAKIICNWIRCNFVCETFKKLLLLPDKYGKKGVVADIVIKTDKKFTNICISAKNNMLYSKSPRPLSILDNKQLDYGVVDNWKKEYKSIIKCFYEKFSIFGKKFADIPDSTNIKKVFLYEPINKQLVLFLNTYFISGNIFELFIFLTGIDKNYVVVNKKKEIRIYDHTLKITKPNNMAVSINTLGYIILHFDNRFIISMRLHTASSQFGQDVSLKYDVKIVNAEDMYHVTVISK